MSTSNISISRSRARLLVTQGKTAIPLTGPIILIDNKLYNSQSTLVSERTLISPDQHHIGNDADTLDGPTPGPGVEPIARLANNWLGYGTLDDQRDITWISEKLDLKYCPQAPLDPYKVLLPDDAITGDPVVVRLDLCSDTTTKNFPHLRDRGESVHNIGAILKYGEVRPYTIWYKAVKWNRTRAPSGVYYDSSVAYTKYMRVDVYGLDSMLIHKTGNMASLLGVPYDQQDTGNEDMSWLPSDDTIWRDYYGRLEQYRHKAMDKASRGVMDVMVTLVELPKTIHMVRQLRFWRTRIRRIRKALKSKNISTRARTLGQIWLEGRYGWRQIVFDVQGMWRLVWAAIKRFRRSYTSGTSMEGTKLLSDETEAMYVSNTSIRLQYEGHIRLRAGVAVDTNYQRGLNKYKAYQLIGGINPVSIFWEITRLSWMLDWLVDIGSLLSYWVRDPARFTRAWHTYDMPYEKGRYSLSGSFTEADVGTLFETLEDCPYGGWIIQRLFLDDEEVLPLTLRVGKCRYYLRIPMDPSSFPLVIPQGILIRNGSQIADMVAVLFNFAR